MCIVLVAIELKGYYIFQKKSSTILGSNIAAPFACYGPFSRQRRKRREGEGEGLGNSLTHWNVIVAS